VVPAGPNAGDIYVTNLTDDSLTIVDGQTHLVAADLPTIPVTQGNPEDVRITPNGAFAYVMCLGDSTVMKFDTATRSDTGTTISGITNSDDLAMDPQGAILIAGGWHVMDLSTDTEIGNTALRGETAIDPTGSFAYIVQTGTQEVAVVDTVSPWAEIAPRIAINLTAGSSAPTEVVFDPVGANNRAYVILGNLSFVSFIDTSTHLEIDTDANPATTDDNAPSQMTRALSNRQNPTSRTGGSSLYWIDMDSNGYVNVLSYGMDCLTYIDTTVPIPIFPVWSVTVGNDPYGFAPSP
jgi:DNA-binding beta-propeller fold protein YncE